jgi:hypothetical protein
MLFDETELPTLTSSAAGSRVRTLAKLAQALAWRVSDLVYGANTRESLATFDRNGLSWKTSQACFLEGSETFSETWPRSGMMLSGKAYQLPPLAPLTKGTASGLWPTPNASKAANDLTLTKSGDGRTKPNKLGWAVALWPTPTRRDTKGRDANCRAGGPSLPEVLFRQTGSGRVNPNWIEWLMGFPIGHTELQLSATPSSRKSPNSSAAQS